MADTRTRTPFWTTLLNKAFRASAADRDVWRDQPLYRKLDSSSRSIRLITLLPGAWSAAIECRLHESKLPSKPPIGRPPEPYKALSYTWKNSDLVEDVRIFINGKSIMISENLYTALRRLRHLQDPLEIWIDSLCINQKDDGERTHQVSLMRDIYGYSEEVVIWLGECGTNDDLGDSLQPTTKGRSVDRIRADDLARIEWYGDDRDKPKVAAYVNSVQAKSRSPSLSPGTRDIFGAFCVIYILSAHVPASHIPHLRHIDYSMPIFRGLYAIMDQSWWRRTWVVQETVVAKKATIYYSRMSAPWEMFSRAALEYDRTHLLVRANSVYPYLRDGKPLAHFARIVSEIESTRRLWENVNTSLLPLLRNFRSRDASDDRDKVFALIGLVRNWGRGIQISPDYSLKPDQVFWETTTRLIAGTRSLSVLAGTLQQESTKWALNPSWITNWACPPKIHENVRLANLPLYNAAKGLTGSVKVHGRWILETVGCHIDSIIFVGQELPVGSDGQSSRLRLIVAEWERSLSQLDTESYVGGGVVSDAFWRLLCGDSEYYKDIGEDEQVEKIGFRRATPAVSSIYKQWRRGERQSVENRRTSIIGGYWQETDGGYDVQIKNAFHHAVECASGYRRMFITSKGYIGTGPDHIQEGDDVFLLFGSRVPFILRLNAEVMICRSETREVLIEEGGDEPTFIPLTKENRSKLIESQQERLRKEICNDVHEHCYHVVGDSYVHGLMDGEVIFDAKQHGRIDSHNIFLV